MTYRDSLYIDAPVRRVFDFLADPRNFALVAPDQIRFTQVVVTDTGVGTRYAWSTSVAGIRLHGSDVFTEYIPDRLITDRSSSALEGDWTYSFAPEGPGTRLTVENRTRGLWNLPPLRQLLDLAAARTHRPRFRRVKAMLEHEHHSSSASG